MGMVQTPSGPVYLPDSVSGLDPSAIGGGLPLGAPADAPPPPAPADDSVPQSVTQPDASGLHPNVLSFLGVHPGLPIPPSATPTAAPLPIQNSPDYPVQAPTPPTPQEAAAAKKAQAKQDAYSASPEGQIAQATQAGSNAIADKAQAQEAKGSEEAAQADETAHALAQRNTAIDQAAQKRDADMVAYNAGKQKKITEYDQAAKSAADYKIDDNRRWSNLSTGRKILAGISVALTGLGDALQHKSGPNIAINMIMDSIKDDVAAQVRDRGNLVQKAGMAKDSLDQYLKMTQNPQDAYRLKMAEESERTARQIEQTAAKHASPIAKQNAMMLAAQIRQEGAQWSAGAAENSFNRDVKRQELSNAKTGLALQAQGIAQADRHFNAQQAQAKQFHDDDIDMKTAELMKQGKAAEAKKLQDEKERLNDNGLMAPAGVTTNKDGSTQAHFEYLKQEDGTPFEAPKEAQKELRPKYEGTMQAIDALDNLRKLRSDNGGDINKWSPDARAKAAEYERALVGAHKAAGISGFRGNVMEVMDKALSGGADPASVIQSVMPLLDKGRENLVRDFNGALRSVNYTGKDVDFPDPLKQGKPAESEAKRQNRVLESREGNMPVVGSPFEDNGNLEERMSAFDHAKSMGVGPQQAQLLDTFAGQLDNPKTAGNARAMLEATATNQNAPENVRQAARAILHKNWLSHQSPAAQVQGGDE